MQSVRKKCSVAYGCRMSKKFFRNVAIGMKSRFLEIPCIRSNFGYENHFIVNFMSVTGIQLLN